MSNLGNIKEMFSEAQELLNFDISHLDTKVTYMNIWIFIIMFLKPWEVVQEPFVYNSRKIKETFRQIQKYPTWGDHSLIN